MSEIRRLLPGETAFGWLVLAFSLFLFCESYKIAGFSSVNSPGVMPLAASGLMVLSSIVVILRNRRSPPCETSGWRDAARRFRKEILPLHPLIGYVVIITGYMILLEPLGFNLTSLLFLFVSFLYLHRGCGLWLAAWLSFASILTIYVVFQLIFQVSLPEGDWLVPIFRLVGR